MDGQFDDVITANRDLVRQFTYLETLANGTEGDPIPLDAYTRLVYQLQTDEAVPIVILTVDSDDNPGYLFIDTPASDGVIRLEVPGAELEWQHSDSGHWYHEMVLLDDNGGRLPFFSGRVLYKRPSVIIIT